jgi:NitT/TauT family transport system substrate-binding protein
MPPLRTLVPRLTNSFLALTVALTIAGCGSRDAGGQASMTIGVQSLILQTYYPQLAQALGFFAKEGLNVRIIVQESTASGVQGLLGGSTDAYLGGPDGLAANEKGADLRFVAAAANRSTWDLVASPGVKSAKDLQGKVIGVSALDSISTATVRQALLAQGVDPARVSFVVAGGTAKRYVALKSKVIQAAPLGVPTNFQAAEGDGLTDLGRTDTDLGAPSLCSVVLTVRKSWADRHRDPLRRFLRAYLATVAALHDPAQQSRIVDITAKGLSVEPKFMKRSLDSLFLNPKLGEETLPRDARIDARALETSVKAFQQFGSLRKDLDVSGTVSQVIDMSYLEDATKTP